MFRRLVLCLLAAMFIPFNGVQAQGITLQKGSLEHGGLTRTFMYYLNEIAGTNAPSALILVLHGGGGSGQQVSNLGFTELAYRADRGVIVVYPDGVEGWNDGRELDWRKGVDDVGFLTSLIEHFQGQYPLEKVFVTGVSNGGIMSFALGCLAADQIDAIAPVIGGLAKNLAPTCAPSHPLPVLSIVGTADRLVPFGGGTVAYNRGEIISAAESIALWRRVNGCPEEATREQLSKRGLRGVTVYRELSTPEKCTSGKPVIWYILDGSGHEWPGRNTNGAGATEVIWVFFQGQWQ